MIARSDDIAAHALSLAQDAYQRLDEVVGEASSDEVHGAWQVLHALMEEQDENPRDVVVWQRHAAMMLLVGLTGAREAGGASPAT